MKLLFNQYHGQMDRVTYWAPVGAKKIKFPVLCANFWSDWIIENKYLNLKFCCKSQLKTEVLHQTAQTLEQVSKAKITGLWWKIFR